MGSEVGKKAYQRLKTEGVLGAFRAYKIQNEKCGGGCVDSVAPSLNQISTKFWSEYREQVLCLH